MIRGALRTREKWLELGGCLAFVWTTADRGSALPPVRESQIARPLRSLTTIVLPPTDLSTRSWRAAHGGWRVARLRLLMQHCA